VKDEFEQWTTDTKDQIELHLKRYILSQSEWSFAESARQDNFEYLGRALKKKNCLDMLRFVITWLKWN